MAGFECLECGQVFADQVSLLAHSYIANQDDVVRGEADCYVIVHDTPVENPSLKLYVGEQLTLL